MKNRFLLLILLASASCAQAAVTEISSTAQFNRAIGSGVVVVEFSQTFCGPCKAIAKRYKALSNEYTGATFLKLEIDTAPELMELSNKYDVGGTPTILIFKNGNKLQTSNIDSLDDHLGALLGKPAVEVETKKEAPAKDESPNFIQNIIDTIKGWFSN